MQVITVTIWHFKIVTYFCFMSNVQELNNVKIKMLHLFINECPPNKIKMDVKNSSNEKGLTSLLDKFSGADLIKLNQRCRECVL